LDAKKCFPRQSTFCLSWKSQQVILSNTFFLVVVVVIVVVVVLVVLVLVLVVGFNLRF